MPLVGDALGAMIAVKIRAIPGVNITDQSELLKFCNAVGEAVVDYIHSNATIQGTVDSGSGAGGSVSGAVL